MAVVYRSSPVLKGESAKAFIEEAERMAKLPTPRLSPKRKAELDDFNRRSKEFEEKLLRRIRESKMI